MVRDGPMQQPLSDYVSMTESNAVYQACESTATKQHKPLEALLHIVAIRIESRPSGGLFTTPSEFDYRSHLCTHDACQDYNARSDKVLQSF
eukprot:2841123-Amphidinium_carterae.1